MSELAWKHGDDDHVALAKWMFDRTCGFNDVSDADAVTAWEHEPTREFWLMESWATLGHIYKQATDKKKRWAETKRLEAQAAVAERAGEPAKVEPKKERDVSTKGLEVTEMCTDFHDYDYDAALDRTFCRKCLWMDQQ